MSLNIAMVTIDSSDPRPLATWWSERLRAPIVEENEGWFIMIGSTPTLAIQHVDDPTSGKNRIHLDFRPDDQQAEVDRVLALGARRVDVGQRGDESWVVLADPEGNEFCILAAADR